MTQNLKGVVQGINLFSTKLGPGIEIKLSLDKTNDKSPDVKINLVGYSKMVPLLREYNKGSHLDVLAEPRNSNEKDSVYFLVTFVNRPPN